MSENGFWCSFEYSDKSIGTWCSDEKNVDEFIDDLLKTDVYIVKFLEIKENGKGLDDGKRYPVRKYNLYLFNRMHRIGIKTEQKFDRLYSIHVVLNSFSSDSDGTIFLSPECVSFQEVNYQLMELEKNIKTIRKECKKLFS